MFIYKKPLITGLESPINDDWSPECMYGSYRIESDLDGFIQLKISNSEKIDIPLNKTFKITKPIHATSIICQTIPNSLELIEDGFDKSILPTSPKIFFNNASSNKMLWRRCERDACHNLIGDETSDINFIRVQTELFNDKSTITRTLGKNILNVGSLHKTKDEQFELWKNSGLEVPEFHTSDFKRELDGEWLVRTNDQACAHNILPATQTNIKKICASVCDRMNGGFKKSKVMLVKRILPDASGVLYLGRIYFVNGEIFCSCCNLTHANKNIDQFYLQSIRVNKHFFKAHKLLEDVLDKYAAYFKVAIKATGLDVGAIDFFYFKDREPILLEVNSYWGMGNPRWPHSAKDIRWLMIYKNDERVINKLYMDRFDEFGFWLKFYDRLGRMK